MDKAIVILMPIYLAYIVLIGLMMFAKRFKAIKDKSVHPKHFKDYQGDAPYELQVYKNHFENQFQFPVIFFVLCVAVLCMQTVTLLTLVLSYIFVLSRFMHSYFHLGSNNLRLRGMSYFMGAISVLVLFIEFAFNYYKLH